MKPYFYCEEYVFKSLIFYDTSGHSGKFARQGRAVCAVLILLFLICYPFALINDIIFVYRSHLNSGFCSRCPNIFGKLAFILYFHVKSHSPLEIHEKCIFQQKVFLSTFALVLPVQRSSD